MNEEALPHLPSPTTSLASGRAERRRRVLIVVGCYDPGMLADMHRARMLAFDLPAQGWDVELLAPHAAYQSAKVLDADSAGLFAPNTPVHFAPLWADRLFRTLTMRSVSWRAWWPMYRLGAKLLADRRFDLVYISTTQFPLFCLGRAWQQRLGVPYVLDFHDPWHKPDAAYATSPHHFKAGLVRLLSKHLEQYAVRGAAGLVAVSQRYLDTLSARFRTLNPAWLRNRRMRAIPFAASLHDLEAVPEPERHDNSSAARPYRIVHVGAGGIVRRAAVDALCRALLALRIESPELAARLRIELHATTRDPHDPAAGYLQQLANQHQVGDLVQEFAGAATYRRSIELAHEADGLLVLGVDDPGYTPSKLFGYLLFGKPVLASLLSGTPAQAFLCEHPDFAERIDFDMQNQVDIPAAMTALRVLIAQLEHKVRFDRRDALQAQLSPAMAAEHAALFEQCVEDSRASVGLTSTDRESAA